MKDKDEFGKDPTVQRTRKLFSMMEKTDKALLESLNLSPFDERLKTARNIRLNIYEKSFTSAIQKGMYMDEATALELFIHCQKIAFEKIGKSPLPEEPNNPEIVTLIQEVLG